LSAEAFASKKTFSGLGGLCLLTIKMTIDAQSFNLQKSKKKKKKTEKSLTAGGKGNEAEGDKGARSQNF
jgi:hypothetical protein